jgi:hypothetical protein
MAEAGACIVETRSLTPEARRKALKSFSADAFQQGRQATSRWIEAVEAEPVGFQLPTPYRLAWLQRNRKAGIANDR